MTGISNTPLLVAQDLSVRFGGVLAVNKVSFEVQRGEVFTLIGPNGAGKTTVFHLISGICTPTTGSLHLDGALLSDKPPHAIAAPGNSPHLPELRAVRKRHRAAKPADRPPHPPAKGRRAAGAPARS